MDKVRLEVRAELTDKTYPSSIQDRGETDIVIEKRDDGVFVNGKPMKMRIIGVQLIFESPEEKYIFFPRTCSTAQMYADLGGK